MIHSGLYTPGPYRCPICQQPGRACGDDHMRRGPVDNTVNEPGGPAMPEELQEYQYVVNNMITTAMLTPEMAKKLNAKPVGSDPDEVNGGYTSDKNAKVYASTGMSSAVVGGKAVKPVREQQQGIKGGRTASMRAGTDLEDDDDEQQDDERGERRPAGPVSTAPTKRRTPQDK